MTFARLLKKVLDHLYSCIGLADKRKRSNISHSDCQENSVIPASVYSLSSALDQVLLIWCTSVVGVISTGSQTADDMKGKLKEEVMFDIYITKTKF